MQSTKIYHKFFIDRSTVKLIAIVTMLLDHIGLFFEDCTPFYFRILGRLSAPLFIFLLVDGFIHSSNRKNYFFRLYCLNIYMVVLNYVLDIEMNFIRTLLIIFIILCLIEQFNKGYEKRYLYLFLFVFMQFSLFMLSCLMIYAEIDDFFIWEINSLMLGIITMEGGLVQIILGILLYFSISKKQYIYYFLFVTVYSFLVNTPILFLIFRKTEKQYIYTIFLENILGVNPLDLGHLSIEMYLQSPQWIQLLLIPLFYIYKRDTRKKTKILVYSMYLIYPIHICILSIIKGFFI